MPQPSVSLRQAALEIVLQTLQGQELQKALHQGLLSFRMEPQDSALCTRICYCYLRLKGRLDYILQNLCSKDFRRLPVRIRLILGLALFELLYLERVPDYASVYWYVQYCKKKLAPKLASMVNAVLRRAARERQEFLQQDFFARDKPSTSLFLSRYYSSPQWLTKIWLHNYGRKECEHLLTEALKPPWVGLRINQSLPEADHILTLLSQDPDLQCSQGYGLALERAPAGIGDLEAQGLLSRQSMASQQALLQLVPGQWPQPVWDACAGHGGKTGLLLENRISRLWASDISINKVIQAQKELSRLHLPRIPLFAADAAQGPPLQSKPATLLLDAPCSGLGVLSRRPDIKWKLRKKDLQTLSRLQQRMLQACLDILPDKGRLYYLTCTLNPGENQEQTAWLIKARRDVVLQGEYAPDLYSGLREFFYAAWLQKK